MADKYYINSIGVKCRRPLKYRERRIIGRVVAIIIVLSIVSTIFIIIFCR